MSHTIKISDETYEYITNEAAKNGVEPDVWVEKAISSNSSKAKILLFSDKKVSERARKNAWKKFIGAIDSSKTDNLDKSIPLDKRIKSVFGDAVDKKGKKPDLMPHAKMILIDTRLVLLHWKRILECSV